MAGLPTGTVTFLFTDIEASTRLIQHLGDAAAQQVFAAHRRLLRHAVESAGGHAYQDHGESFLFVFPSAHDAIVAAVAAQRALSIHPWPEGTTLQVRMGLHTGEPVATTDGYVGLDVHRAARICGAGHGGQILMSQQTQELAARSLPDAVHLRDLGFHRLKDLQRPEELFQVIHPDGPSTFPPLRTLDPQATNLPVQLSSFIGREDEIAQVKRLLGSSRLVTVTGPGGTGKTRLAIQVGAEIAGEFRDGVWLAELAAITDPALVPQAVASALHLREQPGRPLAAALADYLQEQNLLLVLDNCEHLIGACAQLAGYLLGSCARLRMLVTSQEPLRIGGEITWRAPPLRLPDLGHLPPLERLAQNESVRLFCERAAAVLPAFKLTEKNACSVVQICQQLDGIPLAIELAAVRVKVLPAEQIAARLEDRFRLLTGGMRTILPRHQTLRAAMDWSYDLQLAPERQLLRRLSVFAGGCSLEAAEAICSGDGIEERDVFELMTQLVERSLVVADTEWPAARYRLLETVRQYAREKLTNAGEDEAARIRHRDWFLNLTLDAAPMLMGSDERWLDRLEVEHDNLRAALETSLRTGAPEEGLRLAVALRRFWQVRGYWTEGRQWLEALLGAAAGTPDSVRAKAMNAAAQLAQHQGDYRRAQAVAEESLNLFRALGDPSGIAFACNVLGNVRYEQGDYQVARSLHDESLAFAREAGDTPMAAASLLNLGVIADHEGEYARAEAVCQESLGLFRQVDDRRGIAAALNALGVVAADQGDYAIARIRHEESLAIRRGVGDRRGIAGSLSSLGMVAVAQGDFASARRSFEENLAIRRQLGDRHGIGTALRSLGLLAWREGDSTHATALLEESLILRKAQGSRLGVAECLEALAQITVAADPTKAGRLLGAASTLRQAIGAPLPSSDLASYERTVAAARATLGETAFQRVWEEGRALTLDQAVQHALAIRTG